MQIAVADWIVSRLAIRFVTKECLAISVGKRRRLSEIVFADGKRVSVDGNVDAEA